MSINFVSTRGTDQRRLDEALLQGLAVDGGLYVPAPLPRFDVADFAACTGLTDVAEVLLAPYFAGSRLDDALADICRETFSFPIPLRPVAGTADGESLAMLELFHGPTAAFKDVGARFLAASMARLVDADERRPITILVATSGDTGGAVAAAFHQRAGFEVAVLYPDGRVSPRQQHQLTCWGDNVRAFAVDGSFDDCQRLVKAAFADADLAAHFRFSSANSINIGRLLPQSVYYANAALAHQRATGRPLSLIVPTGNLGNGLAAVLARAMGLPIERIVLATNANRTVPDYLASGEYEARDSLATLASAMDVGNPSNMERLRYLFGEADALNTLVRAESVDDAAIRDNVRSAWTDYGLAICPHTATGLCVWRALAATERAAHEWAIAATAHAAKFDTVVEPLIGADVPVPTALAALFERPAEFVTVAPTLAAFSAALKNA